MDAVVVPVESFKGSISMANGTISSDNGADDQLEEQTSTEKDNKCQDIRGVAGDDFNSTNDDFHSCLSGGSSGEEVIDLFRDDFHENDVDGSGGNGIDLLQEGIYDERELKQEGGENERRRSIWKLEHYELPKSTFTWFITESVFSMPFFAAFLATGMSVTSLVIVLINELSNSSDASPWGLPAGVDTEVRIAQYLGIIIGVLMEEEIPLGLELIGQCIEQHFILGRRRFDPAKVIISSLLRMAVGYLFLLCLFFAVLQESDALNIFFDVLALEFIERMDDVIYALSKRGFFGKTLRVAAYATYKYEARGVARSNKFAGHMKLFVKLVYFLNGALMIVGLTIFMIRQNSGEYRCNSILVTFHDDVWEGSWVNIDGVVEKRLLIYSHFNGIYVEDKTKYGRPR
mmetsp:Transcript_21523/g.45518  ORF Transcript_21523/g.45518 Transcript_21523/m.45518 type:complete len:402 (+) Transcript_21523:104-1309(+)